MWTKADTIDLLTEISRHDGRLPSDVLTATWREAGERGRWTLDEAFVAVHAHFDDSTTWIMPAHVNSRIRESRRAQPPPFDPSIGGPGADDDHRMGALSDIRAILSGNAPGSTESDPALGVECSWCKAAVGERCMVPRRYGGKTIIRRPLMKRASHPVRVSDSLRIRAGQDRKR